MTNQEILLKWKQGLSKEKLALIYKREYNMQIRIHRATVRNRYTGKYISHYEALRHVERIIYEEVVINKNKNL